MEFNCIREQADIVQIKKCRGRVEDLNDSFDNLSQGLEMAGNVVRLKILFLFYEESRLCVCDLSDILGMNISAVSQHLRKLKDRGIIRPLKEGKTIYYSLSPRYGLLFKPFFTLLQKNEIFEMV